MRGASCSAAALRHAGNGIGRCSPVVSTLSRCLVPPHPFCLPKPSCRPTLHPPSSFHTVCSAAATRTSITGSDSSSTRLARTNTNRLFSSSTSSTAETAAVEETIGGDEASGGDEDVLLDEEDEAWVESRLDEANDTSALTIQQRVQEAFSSDTPPWIAPSWEERLSSLPQLYTATSIAAHSVAEVNKYFLLTPQQQQAIPVQLLPPMEEELRITGGYMQVHAAYIPIIQRLARVNEGLTGRVALRKPIGVHGHHGAGKSALLAYLSLWARESGWLVVAVRADEFSMERMGWIQPSTERAGIFDQPLYTQHWLNQLAVTQPEPLSRIVLKRQYPFAAAANCHSLLDLLHVARDDVTLATSVLYAFVAELRDSTEVPVLLALDNVNVWDGVSEFVDPDSRAARALPARRLALVDALSTFQHVAPSFGASVFATTSRGTKRNLHSHFNLRKVRPLLLQPYSHSALQHALVHYHVSGVLLAEVDEELVGKVKMLSGAMPKDVKQAAMSL